MKRKAFTLMEILIALAILIIIFAAITGSLKDLAGPTFEERLSSLERRVKRLEGIPEVTYVQDPSWIRQLKPTDITADPQQPTFIRGADGRNYFTIEWERGVPVRVTRTAPVEAQ